MIINGIDASVSEYEIILVDDGSTDNSRDLIKSILETDKRVRAVFHQHNMGKGAALRSGIEQARMEWVLIMDADLQIDISELTVFLPYCGEYDIITGFRKGRTEGMTRSVVSKLYHHCVAALIGVNVHDVGCPFKLLRKSVIKNMHLTANGFVVDAEIFQMCKVHHHSIKEIGVKCMQRQKGESTVKMRHFIQTFFELVLLRMKQKVR
jgi:dolichol-phosphate mannosyltransferase